MDLVQIALGIVVLATLVVAFLAAKKWHWAHVLVVVGLVFASVGYLFLMTQAMQARLKWQRQEAQSAERLQDRLPLVAALTRGAGNPDVIRRLRSEGLEIADDAEQVASVRTLQEQFRIGNRLIGRTWPGAVPQGVDQQTGEVRVVIEEPRPLGIDEGALVFVFEEGVPTPNDPASGPQYLGEFRVVAADDQAVTLAPVQEFDAREADRLIRSRGSWTLHENMPVDDPSLFAGLPEETLQAFIPEAFLDEYRREGTPWTEDDGEETKRGFDEENKEVGPEELDRAVRFEYRRRLRDYATSFQSLAQERVRMLADILAVQEDNRKLSAALEGAEQLRAYREEKQRKLRNDLAGVERDRQAIEAHLAALQRQVERAEALLAQTLSANAVLADELAAAQQAVLGRDLRTEPAPSRPAVDVDAL